ncbi:MAG: nitroreductase family protein [bacterium]
MLDFTVDEKLCTRCGVCVRDCPSRIIAMADGNAPSIAPEQETACLQCQHCLAVCPTAAVGILGRKPADSLPLSTGSFPTLERMELLVRGRRSVRQYRDENVDPALLRRLLAAMANAPTGVNRHELTFTVIDDKDDLHRLREKVLAGLAASTRIPERYGYLIQAGKAYHEHHNDIIFRGAPHAIFVSAPPDAPCPGQDVALSLAYFELLAQSAGLGTVWWGIAQMFFAVLPELKALVGIPPKHVYYAMLFGIPSVHYHRTVQRDNAAVVRHAKI